MNNYIEDLTYIVITAIITYPFFSFIIDRFIPNKWLNRLIFILLILGGWGVVCKQLDNPVFRVLAGSLLLSFLVFHLITDRLRKISKEWRVLLETTVTGSLFLLTLTAVALAGNFRITKVIMERHPNGGYSFMPGCWDEMFQAAAFLSVILIATKYFYSYWQEKTEEKKQKKIKEVVAQKELVQAQLDALHAKINPHFLYNSLNTIAGLALVDAEKTRQMALALSRFFRYSINKEQTNLIPVSEEVEMIRTYLEIEKIRFSERLDYQIETDAASATFLLPRLLLQPLTENCIKHGWKGDTESIQIRISIRKDTDTLILSVKDNGAPFPAGFIPGYGLKSTYDKLDLLFPDRYKLEIVTDPEKEVRITLLVR